MKRRPDQDLHTLAPNVLGWRFDEGEDGLYFPALVQSAPGAIRRYLLAQPANRAIKVPNAGPTLARICKSLGFVETKEYDREHDLWHPVWVRKPTVIEHDPQDDAQGDLGV